MLAGIKIFQIEKFLRDFVLSSIISLNISAFYVQAPYKPVPYKKKRLHVSSNFKGSQFQISGVIMPPDLLAKLHLGTSPFS